MRCAAKAASLLGFAGPAALAISTTIRGMASSSSFAQAANVWCVGRNYADHVKELGNAPMDKEGAPMIFLKAGSSQLATGSQLKLPAWSSDVHHEVELAIELGHDLQPSRAAVALDLTARDVQAKLKAKQWPWTLAKSFPNSTPMGTAVPVAGLDLQNLDLHLEVNGKVRQHGSTALMLYRIPVLLQYVRDHFPVAPGDVVLTGTPAGVSALKPGDHVVAKLLDGDKVLSEGSWHVIQ